MYKKYTETLVELLDRLRIERPEYQESKITYAGRLDPLAEGLVIILTDTDVYRKDEFLGFDKEYRVECLIGVSTDTYDILGVPKEFCASDTEISRDAIRHHLFEISLERDFEYPPFSSRKVFGKPLWLHAREGNLEHITIPTQQVNIYKTELISLKKIYLAEYIPQYIETIRDVSGNFRQDELISAWQEILDIHTGASTYLAEIECSVSSGTYVRSLVQRLGQRLGVGACSIRIIRSAIGPYTQEEY